MYKLVDYILIYCININILMVNNIIHMQQHTQTPTLKDFNEDKTILDRIRKLELQIAELIQYVDMEKTKTNLLMEVVGINKEKDFSIIN